VVGELVGDSEPAVVLVSEGKRLLIRRRDGYEDMTATEIIPPYLAKWSRSKEQSELTLVKKELDLRRLEVFDRIGQPVKEGFNLANCIAVHKTCSNCFRFPKCLQCP
jgi:hypothetical protein